LNLAIVVRVHAPEPKFLAAENVTPAIAEFFDDPRFAQRYPYCDFDMTEPGSDSLLDAAFVSVWRQALVEGKKIVTVNEETYAVRRTPRHHLAQVDFELSGQPYRGLEQNPQTKSRWAQMARSGAKVMQFLQAGQYVGVVADGVLKHYERRVAEE
jgi:hypothetical protein